MRTTILVVNKTDVSKIRDSSIGSTGEDHAGALTSQPLCGASSVTQEIVAIEHTALVAE
jgi:hypothetical protein